MADPFTPESFARDILAQLGLPVTPENISLIEGWERAEGGNWNNSASYNPLNTTQHEPGSRPFAPGQGVQAYPDAATGERGTVDTLRQKPYSHILADLAANDPNRAAQDIVNSPWAEGHYGGDPRKIFRGVYGMQDNTIGVPGGDNRRATVTDQTGFSGLQEALQSQIAPEEALYNLQINNLGTAQSLALADLQQKLAYQQSLSDLKRAGLQRRQGEFGQEKALTEQEQNLSRYELDRRRQLQIGQEQLARQMLGLEGKQLELSRSGTEEQYKRQDISDQQLKAREEFAGGQYERSRQSEIGSAAARGATYTPGLTNALSALGSQRQLQLAGFQGQEQGAQLNRQDIARALQGLDIQGSRLGLQGQEQGIAEQLAGLGYDTRSQEMNIRNQLANIGMNESGASFQDALQQLALASQYRQQQGAAGAAEIPIQFDQQMLDIMQKQAALQGGVANQALGIGVSSPTAVSQAFGGQRPAGSMTAQQGPAPAPAAPPGSAANRAGRKTAF